MTVTVCCGGSTKSFIMKNGSTGEPPELHSYSDGEPFRRSSGLDPLTGSNGALFDGVKSQSLLIVNLNLD